MSVFTFIAANCPMDEVRPSKEYPLEINIDKGRFMTVMPMIISLCASSGKYLIIQIKSMAFFLNGLTIQKVEQN